MALVVQRRDADAWADFVTTELGPPLTGNIYSGLLNLPDGDYRISASATSARDVQVAAVGSATLWRGLEVFGQAEPATPKSGAPVRCVVSSTDPDGDEITFEFIWELLTDGVWTEKSHIEPFQNIRAF